MSEVQVRPLTGISMKIMATTLRHRAVRRQPLQTYRIYERAR